MLDDRIAIDVLPATITVSTVTTEGAAKAILGAQSPSARVTWDDILCDPDIGLWKTLLFGDIDAVIETSSENKQAFCSRSRHPITEPTKL